MHNNQPNPSEVLTFRRFKRKGYALFACLGREVRIGVLTAATLACATPRLTGQTLRTAQGADSTSVAAEAATSLSEAVVSASRAPLEAAVSTRQVTVLTPSDLDAAGVTTINDALKLAASVDVRQRGAFGMQTDISIDGGTFDQITLLVNGIPVNNPQTGHNAADFPVNLSDILRIEILDGAAARLFGTQAFSGAVNIVTRPSGSRLSVSAAGGTDGTVLASARTAWTPAALFATSLSGSWQRSDGAVRNSAFQGGKLFWQGRYDAPAVRVDAQAALSANDFGANTFYSAAYPDQWEATRRYLLSVRAETRGRLHLSPQVSWLRNVDHYQLTRHSAAGENFNRSDVYTLGLNAWTRWALGRTAFGAELREEELFSGNLGRELDEGLTFPIRGQDSARYTRRDGRTNVSFFLEHSVVLRAWTFSAGVMAMRNTALGRGYGFYPGIDVSFRPGGGWKLYASWNRSMRLPTFTDLWYKSPTQEGNTGLRPEKNSAFRLGADWQRGPFSASAKAYYNHGTDMIDWVMYTADDVYHATNFQLDNMGFNLAAGLDAARWLGSRQPLTRVSVAYAYIHQNRRDATPVFKSNYALEYLRHKFTASLSHRIFGPLSARWSLRVEDREGGYLAYEGGQSTGEVRPYGAHAVLDCRLTWQARRWSLRADVTNLTGHRYYDIGNVEQPGCGFLATFGLQL